MKTLKTELKQHFVSAYVNQHLSDRAGYPEEWNIDNLILAAEALFDKYLEEPLGKNWDYDALKKVLLYNRDFPAPYIDRDCDVSEHAGDALAYCIKAHFPSIEFPKVGEIPKAKVFNGSDFPNDENNRYFWNTLDKYSTPIQPMIEMGSHVLSPEELKQKVKEWRDHPIARLPYSPKSKDEFQVKCKFIFGSTSNDGVNWADQFGDTANKISVIHWFEAQGTAKHLSIAKRLREIASVVGEIHDEIIIEL